MSGSNTATNHLVPWALGIALLLFVPMMEGCVSAASDNPFAEATNTDRFILRVESRNTYEVSVFVNPAGRRNLLGTVPGNGLEFFEFDYPAGRPLNVELETRIGDRYRLPAAPIFGGGRVDLVVMNTLRNSRFVRRSPD